MFYKGLKRKEAFIQLTFVALFLGCSEIMLRDRCSDEAHGLDLYWAPSVVFRSPLMSHHVFLPDGVEANSGLAGEMRAELYPELLLYIHTEGTLDTL